MASRILSTMRPQLPNNFTAHGQLAQTRNATRQSPNRHQDNEHDIPRFSFKDLGASPTVKAVVYIALGIYGTAETYFYGRWAYEKFYRGDAAVPEDDKLSPHAIPQESSADSRPKA